MINLDIDEEKERYFIIGKEYSLDMASICVLVVETTMARGTLHV